MRDNNSRTYHRAESRGAAGEPPYQGTGSVDWPAFNLLIIFMALNASGAWLSRAIRDWLAGQPVGRAMQAAQLCITGALLVLALLGLHLARGARPDGIGYFVSYLSGLVLFCGLEEWWKSKKAKPSRPLGASTSAVAVAPWYDTAPVLSAPVAELMITASMAGLGLVAGMMAAIMESQVEDACAGLPARGRRLGAFVCFNLIIGAICLLAVLYRVLDWWPLFSTICTVLGWMSAMRLAVELRMLLRGPAPEAAAPLRASEAAQ